MASRERKAPSEHAKLYALGHVQTGLDGQIWEIVETRRGVRRWQRRKPADFTATIGKTATSTGSSGGGGGGGGGGGRPKETLSSRPTRDTERPYMAKKGYKAFEEKGVYGDLEEEAVERATKYAKEKLEKEEEKRAFLHIEGVQQRQKAALRDTLLERIPYATMTALEAMILAALPNSSLKLDSDPKEYYRPAIIRGNVNFLIYKLRYASYEKGDTYTEGTYDGIVSDIATGMTYAVFFPK
jgi:hypothetical protein